MTISLVPSGIPSYADVQDVIESIVNTLGRKYPIPGFDFDDTAQEIRMECVRVLNYYDSSRIGESPFKFLQTCVRNFLHNKRRGIYIPNNPPCVRCPLWDRANKLCTIDEVDCDKIVQYRANMSAKASLCSPASLEFDISSDQHEDQIEATFLDQSIREIMPKNLIEDYEKLIEGKKINPAVKNKFVL